MTRLLINATTLSSQPTGLGIYSNHCIAAIANRFRVDYISTEKGSRFVAPNGLKIGSGKFAALKRAAWLNTRSINNNYLLYSPTHHGCWRAKRQVITIHDLIAIHQPDQHPNQHRYFRYFMPHFVRRCEAIFTVSEFTKSEICEYYRYPSDRIFIIPNGIDRSVFDISSSTTSQNPYILIVGANYPHKNVEEIIRFSALWKDKYSLVIASCSGAERDRLSAIVEECDLSQRVTFTGYLSQSDLISLYRSAAALIYPSKIEGFGIPPLEALACGTPVIASNIPVLREVLGNSAFFVNLGCLDSWAKAFANISSPSSLAEVESYREETLSRWTWSSSGDRLTQALLSIEPSINS